MEPRHTFDEVVRCVKLGLRLEIDRLTSTGKDTLFARMASSGDTCVLRRGKVTLRTSGAVETGFYVEPLESLSAVEDRITAKLAALTGIHTPLFGCETVTGRFLTLRDGVLQVGDPLGSTEAIPVAKGASLERVLDQVKEALLKRAGAAVGNARPASAEQCRFYLYLPNDAPFNLVAGVRFVPDAPLPKGHAEVVTGGTIGATGIEFRYSVNGGIDWSQTQQLGTASSWTVPNCSFALAFAAGTLIAADLVQVHTTAPKWDDSDFAAAIASVIELDRKSVV